MNITHTTVKHISESSGIEYDVVNLYSDIPAGQLVDGINVFIVVTNSYEGVDYSIRALGIKPIYQDYPVSKEKFWDQTIKLNKG